VRLASALGQAYFASGNFDLALHWLQRAYDYPLLRRGAARNEITAWIAAH
jgi:hypothetical protein